MKVTAVALRPHLTRVLGSSGVMNLSRRRRGGGGIWWDISDALRFLRWSKQQNRGKQHWREGQPGGQGMGGRRKRKEGDEEKKRSERGGNIDRKREGPKSRGEKQRFSSLF